MQPNLLDNFFRDQLKDKNRVPDGLTFRRDKVFSAISEQLPARSSGWRWVKYAVLLALFLLSGYWHVKQQQTINAQQQLVAQHRGLMERYIAETEMLEMNQQLIIDSLKRNAKPTQAVEQLHVLPSLPALVTTPKLVVAPTIDLTIQETIYISNNELPSQKSNVPELDLPVYYESERLANHTPEASKRRSLSRKLNQLLNN